MTLEESFQRAWAGLEPIGRAPLTGGYNRFAWTSVDAELADWFAARATERALLVQRDRNGNQWAWWGQPGPGAIVTGSHLDSVPGGGAFDGPLGVVSAFLAIDDLRSRGAAPQSPIAVVRFTDEEGARFGVPCVGSRLLTGALTADRARELTDASGVTLTKALRGTGVDASGLGRDERVLRSLSMFVELHIEQGRELADVPAVMGLGAGIWPHGRWRYSFTGEANHAGTTRLADRHDPVLAFAATATAARQVAQRAGALATFGKVQAEPGAANGIASHVLAWLDARAASANTLDALAAEIGAAGQAASRRQAVSLEVVRESYTPSVQFDANLTDRIAAALHPRFGTVPVLPTGAGHDAGILADAVPTAMLFVRNPTGITHSPAEQATVADCVDGIRALSAVLEELAC